MAFTYNDTGHPLVRVSRLYTKLTLTVAPGAGGDPWGGRISADGRFVAFNSDADNLSVRDNDGVTNEFVEDLETRQITLVSRASGRNGSLPIRARSSTRSRPMGATSLSPTMLPA
jgi:hypothetical protein